jgi:hypothetical protein
MLGAINQAVSGINAGYERLDRAAGRLARDGGDGDLAGNLIELKRAAHDIRTNVAVVRTADDTIGTLLDLFA